jgi:hypothetical protein
MQHTTFRGTFHCRIRPLCRLGALRQLWRAWRQSVHDEVAGITTALPPLAQLAGRNQRQLPRFLRDSPLALKYLTLLGGLDWASFPTRPPGRAWPGPEPQSPLPYVIALLIRLDQRQHSMGELVDLLRQQPELAWLAGFAAPLSQNTYTPSAVAAAVPNAGQFSKMLRRLPNPWLQALLGQSVQHLRHALPPDCNFGEAVAFDTKHIVAWVKENNPKEHLQDHFDKTHQPLGDPDCKLGCKRRTNKGAGQAPALTPAKEGIPAEHLGSGLGEFYWGYASGIAVTKVPLWGEFVLAEHTATFDQPDVSYFFPLMQQVEQRLGHKPRCGTADAAFDAHYIYDYFHQAGGFAAIPNRFGDTKPRHYAADGTPLCAAGLPMVLRYTYLNRTSRIPYQCQRWACPLLDSANQPCTEQGCPIQHKRWRQDGGPQCGCRISLPVAEGARIRHQLDRHSAAYLELYNQRTACERIFSQAVALGIEHPKLRNGRSIANLNTLIYTLLNLRTLQRVYDLHARLVAP